LLEEGVGFEDDSLEVCDDVAIGSGVEEFAVAFAFFLEFFEGEEEFLVLGVELGLDDVKLFDGGLQALDEIGEVLALGGGEIFEVSAQGVESRRRRFVGAIVRSLGEHAEVLGGKARCVYKRMCGSSI
jgi:hypothetical protein